ncbi:RNA-guided endonuclease InsQ/TnpB family protein [Peptococcus simiae]|uniref:RNA-guided endonuclease InsQ/TnpB family protein n=1 Tax=Peptococcus simiae TaxID=1643805 RepID=A0ABW9GZV8_9FIRM
MYRTLSCYIRSLNKDEYESLRELCRYSNNLYNVALYNIRQHYFKEQKYLNYESNYHLCKENENYKMIQAGVAQQTLKAADRSFKSFFGLLKKASKGEYRHKDIRIPKYREKGGSFSLILQKNAINIRKGKIKVPMSRAFSKTHKPIYLTLPPILEGKVIEEIRIIPIYKGRYFKIQYCYKEEPLLLKQDSGKALAIDLGVNNLATCLTSDGTTFIMDGRKLKSINRHWNKRKARLQSIAAKQGLKTTKVIQDITIKRNNRCKDYIRKTARYIINYAIDHKIGTIVCGYNPEMKKFLKLGKKNNQTFTQISFSDLRNSLKFLCEYYGITYMEQEESYTSKASFLDQDPMPAYPTKENASFSGKRIHRGLYQTSTGQQLNADVNAAANILRKSNVVSLEALYSSGVLGTPARIRVT